MLTITVFISLILLRVSWPALFPSKGLLHKHWGDFHYIFLLKRWRKMQGYRRRKEIIKFWNLYVLPLQAWTSLISRVSSSCSSSSNRWLNNENVKDIFRIFLPPRRIERRRSASRTDPIPRPSQRTLYGKCFELRSAFWKVFDGNFVDLLRHLNVP